jgi:RNA polymerase sigma-70 factor (ECF subfamily)
METDKNLILRAQKGDNRAFEELVKKYDRQVLNIAYYYRNSVDDAKDIYQEVFLRVHKALKKFQFRSEFSTWLYRITTNVCISYKSSMKKHFHEALENEFNDVDEGKSFEFSETKEIMPDQYALGNELSEIIKKALDHLPKQQKMAFTLKYYQGYKIKEIAEMMNCAEGTIKRYLFTSTDKMRVMLSPVLEK